VVNRTDAPVLPGVTFEVERFEWTADDRLALVGRWFGLRGHRFLRPTLDVDVAGERRRMLADLEHKPWAAEEGEEWVAEFRWRGAPAHFDDPELTVSPDLAVQLPQPHNSIAEADLPEGAERFPARPPRTAVLEAELAAAAEEMKRLTNELTKLREEHAAATKAATAELARVKEESDAAVAARAEGLGAAERERDEALERLAAVEQERDEARARIAAAEAERQAAADARDEARAERNAWMSRARAASLPPAPAPGAEPPGPAPEGDPPAPEPRPAEAAEPLETVSEPDPPDAGPVPADPPADSPDPPAQERRTIRIGERPPPAPPGPVHAPLRQGGARQFLDVWGPRLVAIAVLIAVLAIVALVLVLAL
jgi:hypothetical protein